MNPIWIACWWKATFPGEKWRWKACDVGELRVLAIFDKPDPLEGPYFEETIYVTPSRLTEGNSVPFKNALKRRASNRPDARTGTRRISHRVDSEERAVVWPLEIAARPIGGLVRAGAAICRGNRIGKTYNDSEQREYRTGRTFTSARIECARDEWERESRASGVMMIPVPAAEHWRRLQGEEAARAATWNYRTVDYRAAARLHRGVAGRLKLSGIFICKRQKRRKRSSRCFRRGPRGITIYFDTEVAGAASAALQKTANSSDAT